MSDSRKITTMVNAVYYDTTFITNSIQNNICHYLDINNIQNYNSINITLNEELKVNKVHFLYFTSQRVVELKISTDVTITLRTQEFLLYQPNSLFNFSIKNSIVNSADTCSCNINCLYATRLTNEE